MSGGGGMNLLPYAEKAVIPLGKITDYSLDFDKDPNKAEAFRAALGYTKSNSPHLIKNIYDNIGKFEAVSKGNNGYGEIYEIVLNITGYNKKNANIVTGWIVENGTNYPRLTNVYVTKKKVRGELV